jgi:choline dehydrogenase-like flavoprotein
LIQHSKPTRFGEKYGETLTASRNVRVLLNSTLIGLIPDAGVRTIERGHVATLSGNRFSVESRIFIIACGAIENARLLLASDGVSEKGIGNDRDLVGRYFLDHPSVRPAGIVSWMDDQASKLAQYALVDGVRATLALGVDLEEQRRNGLTNSQFLAEGTRPIEDAPADAYMARFLDRIGRRADEPTVCSWWLRCEQSPNPSSRVTLSGDRDALGVRRPVLDWRLQDLDRHTLASVSRLYAERLTRAAAARVRVERALLENSEDLFDRVTGDWHHMGTTRMADGPGRGVVDSDCRVFGVDNLYVAGASVFPTGGAINPTLTLVALALRLADHVGSRAS